MRHQRPSSRPPLDFELRRSEMAFVYVFFLGNLALVMWYADTVPVRIAVLLACATASLIFGGLAARGM